MERTDYTTFHYFSTFLPFVATIPPPHFPSIVWVVGNFPQSVILSIVFVAKRMPIAFLVSANADMVATVPNPSPSALMPLDLITVSPMRCVRFASPCLVSLLPCPLRGLDHHLHIVSYLPICQKTFNVRNWLAAINVARFQ